MLFWKTPVEACSTPIVEITPPTVQGHGDDDGVEEKEEEGERGEKEEISNLNKTNLTPLVYILILMAFILLLLTTLSALTIPEIALLRLEQHGEWVADLGVFGLCFNNDTRTHCTRASVGYTLPFVHVAGMSLSAALVVNPVAAGLVGLAMVPRAYFMIIVAAVLAVLALSFNLAFVMVIGAKVKATGEYTAHIRNAVWFSIAAVPILLIALILSRRPGPITDEEASAGSVMSDTTVAGDETKPVHEAESQVRVHRLL